MLAKWRWAILLGLAAPAAFAQDATISAGGTRLAGAGDTFGVQAGYTHDLERHLAASFSYVNEGHVSGHHRDGVQAQLWLKAPLRNGFEVAVGAGPFQYFDTALAETADGFHDAHGTGAAYSAAATWRPAGSRLFWRLKVDRHEVRDGPDATQFLLGVGWRLDQDGS